MVIDLLHYPSSQVEIEGLEGNAQRHLVLLLLDALFDHSIHDGFVFVVIVVFNIVPLVLDVVLYGFVDEHFSEVTRLVDIEVVSRLQSIVQCLFVVIQVEIELR